MAETKEPEKPQGLPSAAEAPPEPSPLRVKEKEKEEDEKIDINLLPEMSTDEIDSMIEESDPEFVKALKGISADKTLTIEQIIVDDVDAALHAEIDLWANAGGYRKILFKVFPFAPKISFRLKLLKFRLQAWIQGQLIRFKNFLYFLATAGRKEVVTYLLKKKRVFFESISKRISDFKKLKFKTKLLLATSATLFFGAVVTGYFVFKQKIFLPQDRQFFVVNLAEHAHAVYSYDPATQVEPYIDNPRAAQNLILIQKMVVNLKPSQNSGPNPMLAAEFFVEGMSADVVVEIKDREVMIRDLMQRTLEEMDYDLVDTIEGKREMLSRLQKEMSRVLTTGRVKSVRIKTIVIKP